MTRLRVNQSEQHSQIESKNYGLEEKSLELLRREISAGTLHFNPELVEGHAVQMWQMSLWPQTHNAAIHTRCDSHVGLNNEKHAFVGSISHLLLK